MSNGLPRVPGNLTANVNNDAPAARAEFGDSSEGTTLAFVFYPELQFRYEKRVVYKPTWELVKDVRPYDGNGQLAGKSGTTRAKLPTGHTFVEFDRQVVADRLYLQLPHTDGNGLVWIQVGTLTPDHRNLKDSPELKRFSNARVVSHSWFPQEGFRGTMKLTYYDKSIGAERHKEYNFIATDYVWKYCRKTSEHATGYRRFGRMTRAPEGTYAGYIRPRNKYLKPGKNPEDSRSIRMAWHHGAEGWQAGVPKGPHSANRSLNVYIHPASRFYHLEGCLAPCVTETTVSDDGFSSIADSKATMDEVIQLAYGKGTTCTKPNKPQDALWFRIRIFDLNGALKAPVKKRVQKRLHFAIFYFNVDKDPSLSFPQAAFTWCARVKSRRTYDRNASIMLCKQATTEEEFKNVWDGIHERAEQESANVVEGAVFSHASYRDVKVGLEFVGSEIEDGTLTREEIQVLRVLPWDSKGRLDLIGCNTGLRRHHRSEADPGWSPAWAFAQRQRVDTYGQAGYAYFSKSPHSYKEIGPSDQEIYLWAYRRGRNGILGDGERMQPIVVKAAREV